MIERRQAKRFSTVSNVRLIRGSGVMDCRMRDISRGGARIEVCQDLTPGEAVSFPMPIYSGSFPIMADGRVIWTKPSEGSRITAGLQFTNIGYEEGKVIEDGSYYTGLI